MHNHICSTNYEITVSAENVGITVICTIPRNVEIFLLLNYGKCFNKFEYTLESELCANLYLCFLLTKLLGAGETNLMRMFP